MAKTRKTYTPKDPAPLSRVVVIWLGIFAASSVIFIAATGPEIQSLAALPQDASYDSGTTPVDLIFAGGDLLQLLAFLVSGFLILKWTYRVSRNANALAGGLKTTPPWAVGWYFVPIGCLWKPYQAMRQIWQVSVRPNGWRTVPTPSIMGWWWAAWLIGNFAGNISFRMTVEQHTNAIELWSDYVLLVDTAAHTIAAVLLIMVVRRISALQVATLAADAFGPSEVTPVPVWA